MTITYDLSSIAGVDMDSIIKDPHSESSEKKLDSLKVNVKKWKHRDKIYSILRYDKNYLCNDMIAEIGLLRSVILDSDKILAFTPPKSLRIKDFERTYLAEECTAEEFIEGTMITLFFDKNLGDWDIATRGSVGANMTFYTKGKFQKEHTFRYMFLQVCNAVNLDFDMLNKEYCYIFVFQHPKNRIVVPFGEMNLYLVRVYKINNYSIEDIPRECILANLKDTTVKLPKMISFDSYENLYTEYGSVNTDYKIVGVMIYHEGIRTKIRNPNYEDVRKLRGNQPKLQYRYLELRQMGLIKKYLSYFSHDSDAFSLYRDQIHRFTVGLFSNYISCFIKKTKQLKHYPFQYKNHMYNLHQMYINELREKGQFINFEVTKNYINTLPISQLMYSLNYNLRKCVLEIDLKK